MKNYLLTLITLFAIVLSVNAQRYETEIFSNVDVTSNVMYGENISVLGGTPFLDSLYMDVYEPAGDTASERYLIIMAHSGSFLPRGVNTLPFGNKNDSAMMEMCMQFAKRGWVAAAINYRLGWNPTPDILGGDQETRASTIISAVYRSVQDMSTAIRFFRKDAATSNTYKIDPDRIAAGGTNSGGYTAIAKGSLNKQSEINVAKFLFSSGLPFVSTDTLGDWEGLGGIPQLNVENHTGYSSDVALVLNMGGASGDSLWIEAGEPPVVNFHGEADALTPINTGVVIVAATGDPIVEVSGSRVIARENGLVGNSTVWDTVTFSDAYSARAQALSSYEGFFPFTGSANGFEPWGWYDQNDPNIADSVTIAPGVTVPGSGFGSAANPFANKPKALAYIDTVMNYFNPRAVLAMNAVQPASVKPQVKEVGVRAYPNPNRDGKVWVSTSTDNILSYELFDIQGKLVVSQPVNDIGFIVEDNLQPGLYLLQVNFEGYSVKQKLVYE
jgi:hypothetical protein